MPYYFWYSIYAIYKYCNDRKKPNYYLVWQDDKLTFQKTSLLQLHSEWNNPLNKLRHGILAWLIIRVLNRIKMGYNKNISITVSEQEVWDDDMGTKQLKQLPVDRLLDWTKLCRTMRCVVKTPKASINMKRLIFILGQMIYVTGTVSDCALFEWPHNDLWQWLTQFVFVSLFRSIPNVSCFIWIDGVR